MKRLRWFLGGILVGIAIAALTALLLTVFLAGFLAAGRDPQTADVIFILGGDEKRLRPGIRLFDQGLAPRLVLTGAKKGGWLEISKRLCPECRLDERPAVFLENSTDTRTDAELALQYSRGNNLKSLLIVTSPYHTRRTQLVFNSIFRGSGIETIVISAGDYGKLVPPSGPWWRDRATVETIWLEFGKILYWELTPFKEFQKGEGG